jgi:dihydrofolate reductase
MTRVVYCTASSLHGVLADEHDSFDWLIEAPQNDDGSWKAYIEGGGALVMGAPTYQWCSTGTSPTDPSGEVHGDHPCWVFTHRDLPGEPVRRRRAHR